MERILESDVCVRVRACVCVCVRAQWYLNDDGIEFLREYLSLPPEIVPATLKKQVRAAPEVSGRDGQEGRGKRVRLRVHTHTHTRTYTYTHVHTQRHTHM